MKFLLGKKLEMTQVFKDDGIAVPVTVVDAGPVVVTQIKTSKKDGYDSAQVGYGAKKHIKKPLKGHFKNHGDFRWVREHKINNGQVTADNLKVGDKIDVSAFEEGDRVTITGISKGKGFQGVVKRHMFHGMPKSHGTKKKHRSPGSIGSRFPQHVRKGKRMAGRMGQDKVTRHNVLVVKIDRENNLIAVKGAVPGARGSLVEIRG